MPNPSTIPTTTPNRSSPNHPARDEYHAVVVMDEHRWLEDGDDPAVRAWTDAQNRRARHHLDALEGREGVLAQLTALFAGGLDIKQADPKMALQAARVASKNAGNRARGSLRGFINQLTADEVKTLLPDIVELATSHGPADTMFSSKIRVSAFQVLVKYHFKEGIKAAPLVAKGKYGCHDAVAIMEGLQTYGSAAKEIIPDLKQLIVDYQELRKEWVFPDTTIPAVENAIKFIKSSKDHPPLLSAASTPATAKDPGK